MTRRRGVAVLFGLLIGIVLAVLGAPAASAHATVSSSDPTDGARLASPPAQVSVTFDESVGLGVGYLKVVNSTGQQVDDGAPTHRGGRGEVISVGLRSDLGADTYLVSWLVTSADSHPVQGSLRFVVGTGSLLEVTPPAASSTGGLVGAVLDGTRTLGYLGLVLLGGAWLVLTVWTDGGLVRRSRLLIGAGWALTTAAAVAELLLQGPYTAAARLSAVTRGHLLQETLNSGYGQLHLLRLILLGVLGWLLVVALGRTSVISDRATAAIIGGIAAGTVVTYPASGHARAANPTWLAISADLAHLLAMSAWIGGLVVVLAVLLPLGHPDELHDVLPVFSRVALGSVSVLAVTGTYQAWRESGTIDALTTTTYGRLVLVKATLFLVLIGLGNLSRRVVQRDYTPHGQTPTPTAARTRIRRTVLIEVLLAVGVLSVTGVLVAEPPGRAAASTAQRVTGPRTGRVDLGAGRSVSITVDPARSGATTVTATVAGGTPQQLDVTAALPDRQFGPLTVRLRRQPDGTYRAGDVLLPAAGRWVFTVVARYSEFEAVTATVDITLS